MELKEYLFRENISATEFARRVGMSREYLSRVKNHKIKPSRHLARSIMTETQGKVTLDDLLRD